MAPASRPRGRFSDGSGRSTVNVPDTSTAENASKAKLSKKRTKTGCLTCRRRRIKCDEEHPICKNCVKSKRHCDGYNQRIVFKPPTFDYQPAPHGGAHIIFQVPLPLGHTSTQQNVHQPHIDPEDRGHPRPRRDDQAFMPVYGAQSQTFLVPRGSHQYHGLHRVPATPSEHPQAFQFAPTLPTLPAQGYQFPLQAYHIGNADPGLPLETFTMPVSTGTPSCAPLAINTAQHEQYNTQGSALHAPAVTMPSEYLVQAYGQLVPYVPQHFTIEPTPVFSHMPYHDSNWSGLKPVVTIPDVTAAPTSVPSRSSHTLSFSQTPTLRSQPQAWTPSIYVPRPELTRPIGYQHDVQSVSAAWLSNIEGRNAVPPRTKQLAREFYEQETHISTGMTSANLLAQATVEGYDDQLFRVGLG